MTDALERLRTAATLRLPDARLPRNVVDKLIEEVVSEAHRAGGSAVARLQLTDDHELCESQVTNLVRELEFLRDSKAFTQLSHAKQDHLKRAIRTRGISLRR